MSVGDAEPRRDALGKVTGETRFPGDRPPVDALWAKVVFSNQPHARMLSFDASAAEALEGVVAVVTAADVPVNEYGLTMFDQPVLVGLGGSDRSAVDSTISRWEADKGAAVLAESSAIAHEAATRLGIQ